MLLLDEIDDTARKIGSVNTIVYRDGKLVGHNTDAPGFLRGLRENGGFDPLGKDVVIVGTGGAGRAVAFGLAGEEVRSMILVNRTVSRAEGLGEEVSKHYPQLALSVLGEIPEDTGYDLLVNCTSVGMRHTDMENDSPVLRDRIVPDSLVYDLIYNPEETVLLKLARESGARTLGGLPMLVFQGAEAFELWLGRRAPADVMFAAAREAMAKR